MKLPAFGLQGTLAGTCAVCLQPTDTGLTFKGEGEFLVAGLLVLGIPQDQGAIMVERNFDCPPGRVPVGRHWIAVRVCSACVDACDANFPAPGLILPGGDLPCVKQLDDEPGQGHP
jgi:hypothetical protein